MTTKNKLLIIGLSITFVLVGVNACEDGLKDETFSVLDENLASKPENGEQAVRGVYAALKDNGGYGYYAGFMMWLTEYPTDALKAPGISKQGGQLDDLTYSASQSTIRDVWVSIYRLIARANVADQLIEKINYTGQGATEDLKKQHLGEVRFLRALAYYDATSLWGDVPLFPKKSGELSNEDENPKLTAQSLVEEAIIGDLEYAENNLPLTYDISEVGRATRGAAKSLLVRLYMRRGEWQKASDKADEVIALGTYALSPDVVNLFDRDNRADDEFIFVLKSSNAPGQYGINSNSVGQNSTPWDFNRGWGNFPMPLSFYQLFSAEDDRRELLSGVFKGIYGQVFTVPEAYGGIGGAAPDTVPLTYVWNLKYPHEGNYNYAGFNNVSIIRYADVLMYKAEAMNELAGPNQTSIDLINEVLGRSSVSPVAIGDFASKQDFRDFIFSERNKEFFMEMRRREDLFRWGKSTDGNPLSKFKEYVKPALDDPSKYSDNVNYTVFPYPQKEIDANTSLDESVNIGRVRY
jgi:starch-binding outer membrane protein, SusD/RagB family